MATIQEINSTIIAGNFTNEQLNSIATAIKFARNQITKQNTGRMVVGTRVKFVNPRTGAVVIGSVSKVARKYISVHSGMSNWRVPASMLETVAE